VSRVVKYQPFLYNQAFLPFWSLVLAPSPAAAAWIGALVMLVTAAVAQMLILRGWDDVLGKNSRQAFGRVGQFVACGGLAFGVTWMLSPGYVWAGYLARYAPFLVFITDAAVGAVLYILGLAVYRAAVRLWAEGLLVPRGRTIWLMSYMVTTSVLKQHCVAIAALVGLLVFLFGYWGHVQTTYVSTLPPSYGAFLRILREPPLLGASIVSNTYAAPMATMTGRWAYMDTVLGTNQVSLGSDGYIVARSLRNVWLADKYVNTEYLRPEYFVCFMGQVLTPSGGGPHASCSQLPLVKHAGDPDPQHPLRHRIVRRDESGRDAWAIVKLDWQYPPYLIRSSTGEAVGLHVMRATRAGSLSPTTEWHLQLKYAFAQQDGEAELGTILRLYGIAANGSACLLLETTDPALLTLPAGFRGTVLGSVTPRTAGKAGRETFSNNIRIGSRGADACGGL
jgi:hypothetical protein